MNQDDMDWSWEPANGDRCLYVPHHPAFKPNGIVHVVAQVNKREDGSSSYWIAPTGPVTTRTLRNGRVVEQRPNHQCLVSRGELRRAP